MNLYILTYERWEHHCGPDTSDGFPTWVSDWWKKKETCEVKSDEAAREWATQILTGEVQSGQKIQEPVLVRAVSVPRMDGVRTYSDLNPSWEYNHYYWHDKTSASV